jgi:cell division protein FtsI (penicillin-binding protein 3)
VAVLDRRIGLLFAGFLALLAVALVRAGYLGLLRAGSLQQAALTEQVSLQPVPAVRGAITDRNGTVLALDEPGDEVIADPYLIQKPDRLAARIAPLLGESVAQASAALSKPRTGYSVLSYDIPASRASVLRSMGIDGLSFEPVEQRVYPRGDEAAQVVGWAGSADDGLAGIEYLFNRALAGRSGERRIVNDAVGQPISVATVKAMRSGKTIALTLSSALESEVQSVLAQVARRYHPEAETAIVTDPQTDQVLALANWPFVNANDISASPLAAREDFGVGLSYEPGSTFKLVTVSGALQDGLVTPSSRIFVPAHFDADGTLISDAEPHGNEELTVAQILKVSSNIGADEIAARMGPKNFDYWVHRYGFGRPTGIDLPGEQSGIVPHWWQYTGTSLANLPFGQGQAVTPIQMIQAYDTVADGGILRTPQIIESIGGRRVREPAGRRIISATVASEVRDMLRGVLADGGTASGAAIPGYDLAGKTGTAQVVVNGQYSNTLFNSSFIGMVPASRPKLVVAVVVEGTDQYGGTIAAPAFQKIVGWAVPYFGINPCPGRCPASAMNPPMPPTP